MVPITDNSGWYTCVVTGVGSQQSRASAYLTVVTDAEALRTTQQEKLQFKVGLGKI